jgi:hypothetical protein
MRPLFLNSGREFEIPSLLAQTTETALLDVYPPADLDIWKLQGKYINTNLQSRGERLT